MVTHTVHLATVMIVYPTIVSARHAAESLGSHTDGTENSSDKEDTQSGKHVAERRQKEGSEAKKSRAADERKLADNEKKSKIKEEKKERASRKQHREKIKIEAVSAKKKYDYEAKMIFQEIDEMKRRRKVEEKLKRKEEKRMEKGGPGYSKKADKRNASDNDDGSDMTLDISDEIGSLALNKHPAKRRSLLV